MFWLVELPPVQDLAPGAAAETADRLAKEGAVTHRGGRPGMHTTRTIDYMVVLDGEVTLLLDDGEVTLHKYRHGGPAWDSAPLGEPWHRAGPPWPLYCLTRSRSKGADAGSGQ